MALPPDCLERARSQFYFYLRLRRITPATPTKPVAIKPSVPGSGVGAGGVPPVSVPLTNW
jgi:hypothetical protein